VNNLTIRFTLAKPASDFLNLLALPFASARPVEYDSYLPNRLQLDQRTISDGPYQITSYVPGRSITLAKSPGWHQSTDAIRHQYVSKITVTIGITNPDNQVRDLRQGRFDLMMDTALPTSQLPSLPKDNAFHVWAGDSLNPFLSLNLRSPRARHAIANLHIRRAFEFGINKTFVQKVLGGPSVAKILDSAEPPGTFDLAMVGWLPDWAGNNGRSILDPLLKTDCTNGTLNFGCYSNHTVDKLITEAETAPSLAAAGKFWTQANKLILADAAIMPLTDGQNAILASSRVHEAGVSGGVVFAPIIGGPDLTNVWLKKG
jgi:ABC-type transport system substrate-binding protein